MRRRCLISAGLMSDWATAEAIGDLEECMRVEKDAGWREKAGGVSSGCESEFSGHRLAFSFQMGLALLLDFCAGP